jgi:hypothetical protein
MSCVPCSPVIECSQVHQANELLYARACYGPAVSFPYSAVSKLLPVVTFFCYIGSKCQVVIITSLALMFCMLHTHACTSFSTKPLCCAETYSGFLW